MARRQTPREQSASRRHPAPIRSFYRCPPPNLGHGAPRHLASSGDRRRRRHRARARRTVRGPVGGSYASQLADYYASGVVGGAGIALFALLSVVVVASVERGNLDPGTLAGAAVVLGVATTLSAAAWATAIEPSPMFRDNLWLVWHARVVVALSVLIPVAAAAYARELLA